MRTLLRVTKCPANAAPEKIAALLETYMGFDSNGASASANSLLGSQSIHIYPVRLMQKAEEVAEHFRALGASTEVYTETPLEALFSAARRDKVELVANLLDNPNLHLNVDDCMDGTPLLVYAASALRSRQSATIKFLLSRGAEVDASTKDGHTALHAAACRVSPENVLALLEAGANVHTRTNYGDTALMLAVRMLNPHVLLPLLQYGADVDDLAYQEVADFMWGYLQPSHPSV